MCLHSRFESATISKKLRNYANDDWLIEEAGVVFTKDVAETAYAIAKEIFELTENRRRARRLQDSDLIQSERWIQGELFSRTEIESVSKFWFWTIRNWGVQKCHIFFIDIKNLFVFCPWICYRLLFILNRFATFYNKLTKINGNLYFKNKRVNTEAKTTYGKTLWHFRTFNHSGIKMMIDVKNWDGGKKISKIDNRKVHTWKALTKVKNKKVMIITKAKTIKMPFNATLTV